MRVLFFSIAAAVLLIVALARGSTSVAGLVAGRFSAGGAVSGNGVDPAVRSLWVAALSCTRKMLSLILRPRYSTIAGCQSP